MVIGNIYHPPGGSSKLFKKTLKQVLRKLKCEGKHLYVTGDFNLNLFNHQTDKKVRDFVTTLYENGCMPTISKATRISRSKETCIDNIIMNYSLDHQVRAGVITEKISDHLPIFVIIDKMAEKKTVEKKHTNLQR